jgi:diguanylate cyclase (GGDEF)-like protein
MLLRERFRANHSHNVNQFAESDRLKLRSTTPPRMNESNSVHGKHHNGTVMPVEIAISKIKLDGAVEFTAVVRDISDRVQLIELLRKQAATDVLTGLPNRLEFLQVVDEMLNDDMPLSIFILDIDSSKNINDRYGHDIGDDVLRVLGNVNTVMPYNGKMFARWGGEEFVAVLPNADSDSVLRVAETFRGQIETNDFESEMEREVDPLHGKYQRGHSPGRQK